VVNATAFATRPAANQAFIYLDRVIAADSLTLRPDHTGAELVKDLKGGFITGKAQLPLKLESGLAGRLCCHQVSAPEPG
jgi:hypothetical protein